MAATLAAFGVISGLFQVFAMDALLRALTFSSTLAFAVGAFLYHRRSRAHTCALDSLARLMDRIPTNSDLGVRRISSEAELRDLWRVDCDGYGEASIPFETFCAWWRAYPAGLSALFRGHEIVGGIGIWPLRAAPYRDLLKGHRKERELSARSIESSGDASHVRWYVSGVVLVPHLRGTGAIRTLLAEALREWLVQVGSAERISICALALSDEGEALLRRFGFRRYREPEDVPDHVPLYAWLNISTAEVRGLVARLLPREVRAELGDSGRGLQPQRVA